MATTVAFLCTHSLDTVQQTGQWSSPNSFADKYLVLHLRDTPGVAMGVPPTSVLSVSDSSEEG